MPLIQHIQRCGRQRLVISEFQASQGGTLSLTLQTKTEEQVFSSPSPKTKLTQDGDNIDKHGLQFHIILSLCSCHSEANQLQSL